MVAKASRLAAASLAFGLLFADESVVSLPFGNVHGAVFESHREFLGIPYAKPPIRFRAPEPWLEPYPQDGLQATSFTPQCMQSECDALSCSEDCLHLNIYAPRAEAKKTYSPVMLWIHGGGLKGGTAMDGLSYNGTHYTERDVLLVAINYRLNAFGFCATQIEGLPQANNGFRDQQVALRWVKSHIEAFGGLSDSITIFGESAGGQSVAMHLVSPGSAGLFDAAISESGDVCFIDSMVKGLDFTERLMAATGCSESSDRYSCLSQVDAIELTNAHAALDSSGNWSVPAVLDGDVYPADPLELVSSGLFNKVPIIFGTNLDEGSLWLGGAQKVSAADMECVFTAALGASAVDKLMAAYGVSSSMPSADHRDAYVAFIGDLNFKCPARQYAAAMANNGGDIRVFSFERTPLGIDPYLGAYHASEIPYVFDVVEEVRAYQGMSRSQADEGLGHFMADLWTEFARTREPDLAWTPFTSQSDTTLKLDLNSSKGLELEPDYRKTQCDFLQSNGFTLSPGDLGTKWAVLVTSVLPRCQHQSRTSSPMV